MLTITCPECGQPRTMQRKPRPGRRNRCRPCARRAWARENPEAARRRAEVRNASQADIDPFVVDTLVTGTPMKATRAERQAAVAELDRRGRTSSQIAARLGISARTVDRLLARNREEAE